MKQREFKSPARTTAPVKAARATQTYRIAVHSEHIRPTQMTVGYAEVLLKRQQWRALDGPAQGRFLAAHPLPAVAGPKGRHYIIDHHHLGRALLKEGVTSLPVKVVGDLSTLEKDEFWVVMDYRQWVHPYDANGNKQPFSELPKTLSELSDDPYRSLAAAVRMAGGFPKNQTPFAEFLWADFFRRRVAASLLRTDPDSALSAAMQIVHDKAAIHLPGWSAPPAND